MLKINLLNFVNKKIYINKNRGYQMCSEFFSKFGQIDTSVWFLFAIFRIDTRLQCKSYRVTAIAWRYFVRVFFLVSIYIFFHLLFFLVFRTFSTMVRSRINFTLDSVFILKHLYNDLAIYDIHSRDALFCYWYFR